MQRAEAFAFRPGRNPESHPGRRRSSGNGLLPCSLGGAAASAGPNLYIARDRGSDDRLGCGQRLAASDKWSVLTRTSTKLPEGYVELGELCRVHRGAVTGTNRGANRVRVQRNAASDLPERVLFPSVAKARELFAAGKRLTSGEGLRNVIDLPSDLDVFDAEERRQIDRFLREAQRKNRMPTGEERTAAVVAAAALTANQKVQTTRRSAVKNLQENEVAKALLASGYVEVERRGIDNFSQTPGPGEFCKESLFGGRKADLVVGLWDGRAMPTECKVSNSSTDLVKRLNNDAAVKAKIWLREFGASSCIPAAVLSGVFKVHNLLSAQRDDLTIFWSHKLETMISFIESTKN